MSTQFPDISQYTPVTLKGAPVALARATISNVKDTYWDRAVADAAANQVPLVAYCFINSGKLGISPEAQADFAYSVVGKRPVMLDHEPNRGQCATLDEGCRWIDRFRSRGGFVGIHYLPKWSWSGWMGSPRLDPLAQRKMYLVSSNYTTYSDAGAGWVPYYPGCPVPIIQWQFTDHHLFNGVYVDFNAIKISVPDYLRAAAGPGGSPEDGMATYDDTDKDHLNQIWAVNSDAYVASQQAGEQPPKSIGTQVWETYRIAKQLANITPSAAPTQDQVNAAMLAALRDPDVITALGAAIASHIKVQ